MQLKVYRKKTVYYQDLNLKKKKFLFCKRWVSVNLVETEMQYLFHFFLNCNICSALNEEKH